MPKQSVYWHLHEGNQMLTVVEPLGQWVKYTAIKGYETDRYYELDYYSEESDTVFFGAPMYLYADVADGNVVRWERGE